MYLIIIAINRNHLYFPICNLLQGVLVSSSKKGEKIKLKRAQSDCVKR